MHRTLAGLVLSVCLGAAPSASLRAQSFAAPAPPTPPPRRALDGRLEIVAARAVTPVRVDGVLDDAVWATAQPVGQFVQAEPDEGQRATEPVRVRVAYDATYLYVAAVCYDDPRGPVVTDIRKDFNRENQDDFEVILDTFGDRRNGYLFTGLPLGYPGGAPRPGRSIIVKVTQMLQP